MAGYGRLRPSRIGPLPNPRKPKMQLIAQSPCCTRTATGGKPLKEVFWYERDRHCQVVDELQPNHRPRKFLTIRGSTREEYHETFASCRFFSCCPGRSAASRWSATESRQ